MTTLSGHEIRRRVAVGEVLIEPYDENKVQPNSVDVTLGTGVCVYTSVVSIPEWDESSDARSLSRSLALRPLSGTLDSRYDNPVTRFKMDESGWLVRPGILYLMHVEEIVCAPSLVMTLNGKSSLARLGLTVHLTAGHAETGFHGQYTMEVSSIHPLVLYPGMDIAQIIFDTVEGEVEDYRTRGNYTGMAALGAQPSRSWRQFKC